MDPIYLTSRLRREFFIVPHCGHKRVCRECLTSMCEQAINSRQFDQLACPECGTRVEAATLMQLLPAKTFRIWRETYDTKLLERRGAVYCPRCDEKSVQTPVVPEECGLGVCSKCEFPFCADCMMPWHAGTPCVSKSKRLRTLQKKLTYMGKFASRSLLYKFLGSCVDMIRLGNFLWI